MRERKEFKKNTLNKVIIRIDFEHIPDFETVILNEVKNYMERKLYEYKMVEKQNISYEMRDPDTVKSEMPIVNKSTVKYLDHVFFNKDNEIFTTDKNYIICEINNFNQYSGLDKYKKIIEEIYEIYKEKLNENFKINRIGIRKINILTNAQNKKPLLNVFNGDQFKNLKSNNESLKDYRVQENEIIKENEGKNYNICKIFEQGKLNILNTDVYRVIIDIDSYIEKESEEDMKLDGINITKVLESINRGIFDKYEGLLSDEFKDYLETKDINDNFKISEGIKINA